MGTTQFSIFTEEEFKLRFLTEMIIPAGHSASEDVAQYPTAAVDWSTQGKVSRIKNQGQCGSCWAFSATGVAESWALFSGKSWDLSEQQLVDCSASYGNHGCNGGWPSSALKYVKDHGLTTESSYPYAAKTNACAKNGGEFHIANVLTAAGCNGLSTGITARPLSITVDATNWSQYKTGVFNNCAASINHAVLLVGTDASGVWKVKNSWGTSWGEAGYIRLAAGNTCGVCANGGVYVS
jgi:C1A family cysteine protease